jgi:hypothetical protein
MNTFMIGLILLAFRSVLFTVDLTLVFLINVLD